MIDPKLQLGINRQARVLGISRGSVYYQPSPISDADQKLMHRIDKLPMVLSVQRTVRAPGSFYPDAT